MNRASVALPLSILLMLVMTAARGEADQPAVNVATARFDVLATDVYKSAPASVISLNDAVISAEISARIDTIELHVGETASQGDVLATLDCGDQDIALGQALAAQGRLAAQRELARQQLARAHRLKKDRNISMEQVDQRQSELDVLIARQEEQTAAIALARRMVKKCRIVAPFTGLVTRRHAQSGAYATPGEPMFQMLDVENIEVSARVRPSLIPGLESSEQVRFEYLGEEFPLAIRAVVAAVDSKSRDQEVRLGFRDSKPLPGQSGRLHWRTAAAVLPARVLVKRDGQLGVFIVNQNHAHFVGLGDALDGRRASAALPPDVLVIVEGHVGLKDGDAVSIAH